jgi:hypothetical protein
MNFVPNFMFIPNVQGVIEIHGINLTTSYWLHVELEKNI